MDQPHHCYLFTHSLAWKIQRLRSIGLVTPDLDDKFFTEVTTGLSDLIHEAFPDAQIIEFSLESLMDQILHQIILYTQGLNEDYTVVSLCSEIGGDSTYFNLEVNRVSDHHGKKIGIGQRPGFPNMEDQVASIIKASGSGKLILSDDGTFSGDTIMDLLETFRRLGKEIDVLVFGLISPEAEERIRHQFSGPIISCRTVVGMIDWVIEHDLLPWIPTAGRLIGATDDQAKIAYPVEVDGMTFSIPYGLHADSLDEFASIKHEVVAGKISRFCHEKAIELYTKLEILNCRPITVQDFRHKMRSLAIPVIIGQQPKTLHPSTRIIDHLNQMVV